MKSASATLKDLFQKKPSRRIHIPYTLENIIFDTLTFFVVDIEDDDDIVGDFSTTYKKDKGESDNDEIPLSLSSEYASMG
jgi:uncharacterized protein YydD (DUF2326 family)